MLTVAPLSKTSRPSGGRMPSMNTPVFSAIRMPHSVAEQHPRVVEVAARAEEALDLGAGVLRLLDQGRRRLLGRDDGQRRRAPRPPRASAEQRHREDAAPAAPSAPAAGGAAGAASRARVGVAARGRARRRGRGWQAGRRRRSEPAAPRCRRPAARRHRRRPPHRLRERRPGARQADRRASDAGAVGGRRREPGRGRRRERRRAAPGHAAGLEVGQRVRCSRVSAPADSRSAAGGQSTSRSRNGGAVGQLARRRRA